MKWPKRVRLRWVITAYFALGQIYVWWQYLTIKPGHERSLPQIVAPAVLEIVVALLIAGYVILRDPSIVWVVLATVNAVVLLVIDFSIWYVSIGTATNWVPRLTRFDGLAIAMGTLTTAGPPGIVPHSELARHLVTVQLVVDILAAIVLFGLFAGRIGRHAGTKNPTAVHEPV